jgi:hypothetical protein
MPASKLKDTGVPHSRDDGEPEQPATTFREGVVSAMHAEQGATTTGSPEADHPAYKYQEAYVEGRQGRTDDTGVAGMPEDRPMATPAEGLGNDPGAGEPEARGEQGGLDSVPDELGANPHPHNQDQTRMRWGKEEEEPMIRKTGAPEVDATMEPGTAPDGGRHGSTELVEDPAAAKGLGRKSAPERGEAHGGPSSKNEGPASGNFSQ